jgi:hypothetical protein
MAGSFLLFVPDKMRLLESRNAAECVHILEAEFRIAFATARYTPMSSRGIPCMRMFLNPISRLHGGFLSQRVLSCGKGPR